MSIRKFLLILALVVPVFCMANVGSAAAVTGADFKPGRIIDDQVFFDNTAMTPEQIQTFLNEKVLVCDTWGTQMYGSQTRAEYGTSRGYPPPYVCLKDYTETTPHRADSGGICGFYNGGTKTSAQIIYDVAQSCGISPKVLIVMLQKEQSLVTDDWPWPNQYRLAMGYGCGDPTYCPTDFQGFFNQVYQSARQFRWYAAEPTGFHFRAGQNNNIQYHPNTACGSSTVLIENQATAGLYNYTPYQPNAAALNNLYGTGDSCSAYGNRNFWRLFNDWFGSTHVPVVVPTASITVNSAAASTVDYGTAATVAWTSEHVSSCTVTPGNHTGTSGTLQLAKALDTTTFTLQCSGAHGAVADTATLTVLPPTFAYLNSFVTDLTAKDGKNSINTKSILTQLEQAEKQYNAGALADAQATLAKTVKSMEDLVKRQKLPQHTADEYAAAVNKLLSSWNL